MFASTPNTRIATNEINTAVGRGERNEQARSNMKHEEKDHDHRDQRLELQRLDERGLRLLDELRPIVEGANHDPLGQAGLQPSEHDLDALDHAQGVCSVAHRDDAADQLAAIVGQRAATERGPERDLSDVANADRHVLALDDDGVLEIAQLLDEADAADHVLDTGVFDDLRADIEVRAAHGVRKLSEADMVSPKPVGVGVDLVFLHEPADRGDLRNAIDGLKRVADRPVLDGAEFAQIVRALRTLDRVPEDLPETRRIRPQSRARVGRKIALRDVQPLQYAAARPVDVRAVPEDNEDLTEAEARRRTHVLDVGDALERNGEGIGDLVLDVLRTPPRPRRVDDDLVLADVGNRIDRYVLVGKRSVDRQAHDHQNREHAVLQQDAEERPEDAAARQVASRRIIGVLLGRMKPALKEPSHHAAFLTWSRSHDGPRADPWGQPRLRGSSGWACP